MTQRDGRATAGDLLFWRYHVGVDTLPVRLVRVAIVSAVDAGIAIRWREVNHESDGEHTNMGVEFARVVEHDDSSFDILSAVAALRRRHQRGFRSLDSARKFMMRFAR